MYSSLRLEREVNHDSVKFQTANSQDWYATQQFYKNTLLDDTKTLLMNLIFHEYSPSLPSQPALTFIDQNLYPWTKIELTPDLVSVYLKHRQELSIRFEYLFHNISSTLFGTDKWRILQEISRNFEIIWDTNINQHLSALLNGSLRITTENAVQWNRNCKATYNEITWKAYEIKTWNCANWLSLFEIKCPFYVSIKWEMWNDISDAGYHKKVFYWRAINQLRWTEINSDVFTFKTTKVRDALYWKPAKFYWSMDIKYDHLILSQIPMQARNMTTDLVLPDDFDFNENILEIFPNLWWIVYRWNMFFITSSIKRGNKYIDIQAEVKQPELDMNSLPVELSNQITEIEVPESHKPFSLKKFPRLVKINNTFVDDHIKAYNRLNLDSQYPKNSWMASRWEIYPSAAKH